MGNDYSIPAYVIRIVRHVGRAACEAIFGEKEEIDAGIKCA